MTDDNSLKHLQQTSMSCQIYAYLYKLYAFPEHIKIVVWFWIKCIRW